MKFSALLLLPALLLPALGVFAQTGTSSPLNLPKPVRRALAQVRPEAMRAHVAYLADDRLLGRKPGTPGYQLAVDYVVAQLKERGVAPAGENGGFTQRVRLRRSTVRPGATASYQPAAGAASAAGLPLDAISLLPHPEQPSAQLPATGLIFAGYGISAPANNYDDYQGLDAKGKVVVVLRGAPPAFPSTVAAASQDQTQIVRTAAAHGAVGVLFATLRPALGGPARLASSTSVLGADGKVAAARGFVSGPGGVALTGTLSAAGLQTLLRAAASDTAQIMRRLRASQPAPVLLPGTLAAQWESTYQDFDSYNVVGKITGSDPKLRDEYVVHSAHLDHLGVGAPVRGDSIYNGAHDNATGVASVLEIAGIYSRLKQKPARSILLVLQTGEELGLLGSAYFAARPTVPAASLVANVNTDMPTIIAPLLSVVPLGAQHSTLAAPVAQAAAYLKLPVEDDPEPEQNRFIRSDQYSFVAQGIPALHLKYGNRTPDGRNNLSEQVKQWRAATYHKPQDDMSGTFDFEAGRTYVQLNFLVGYLIAQNPERPRWNPGDYFGRQFGGQR
ncbi:M28 family peptidase [Hymenobacter actinosclerus]|nr:M28 family peptidase [Hymenobacter actinosclerus]